MDPDLRILLDGNNATVYRRGDKVTGRVVLGAENEEDIVALKVSFLGICSTTTTRPLNPHLNETIQPRQKHQERVELFHQQDFLSGSLLAHNKGSWTFDFKFPELTTPQYSQRQHGPKYLKSPHRLPPSFQTNTPGGHALVAYYVRAILVRGGASVSLQTEEILPYHPTPENMQVEPIIHSRVLHAQLWKPLATNRTVIDKACLKLSRCHASASRGPRIIPTLHRPEMIAPGQNIPLYISLENTQSADHDQVSQCLLDSVTVKISTHTTSMCGQAASAPEDIMVKHVTCLSKSNMAKPLPFDTKVRLANNLRLVDDAECVPTFKTYTITRRYDLTIIAGLKYERREFTVRCTSLLDILPRIPRDLLPTMPEDDEDADADEPLPLYELRASSREFAPEYESLYQLRSGSPSEVSLARTRTRGSSMMSAISTPPSELDPMHFEGAATRP